MPVPIAMRIARIRAGTAECDAVGKLRFEKLAMPGLVRARHDAAGGAAHRGAVEVEPDAADEVGNVTLGQAGIGAGRAGLDAVEACVDAAAHDLGMGRFFRVRPEHGADGDGRHR